MLGELLIIGGQFAFAAGIIFTKKLSADTNPFLVAAIVALIGALSMTPILFYFSKDLLSFSKEKIVLAVLAGIFWIAIGEALYTYGLSMTTISTASLLALSFPLFAITLGIIFFGDPINIKFIIAALLMISGYVLLVL